MDRNCNFCGAKMREQDCVCPNCGTENGFVSKAQQKENIKNVRKQIFRNIKNSIKKK